MSFWCFKDDDLSTKGWMVHPGVSKKKTLVLKDGCTVAMWCLGTNFRSGI